MFNFAQTSNDGAATVLAEKIAHRHVGKRSRLNRREDRPFRIHLFSWSRKESFMKHTVLVLAGAALVAGMASTGSAYAQDRARRAELTANQHSDQVDAQTARIRADLRLTPDQEKNWAGFESAMRDIGKSRADRENTARTDSVQQKGPVDIIDRMHRDADYMSERSADQKKLADAAQPLFASLDDQQKRRFSETLVRISNERDAK
jgi:LTXXQ motif family protein